MVGRDSASSAQSKRVSGGEMAHLGLSWGKLGCMGGNGGVDSERGALAVVNSVVNDVGGVWDVGGGETDGVDHFSGWVGEQKVLGRDVVNTMLFFRGRWCLSSQAVVGSEMVCFQGTWGQHGGWDEVWGHSVGSGSAFRRSPAASHGPKWGRAG